MSLQPVRGESLRHTGKLLATQGYVIGIELSSSGARQSVALADLNGNILQQRRYTSDEVPGIEKVLRALNGMVQEIRLPEHLQAGRLLRAGIAVGGPVDPQRGIVRTLYHVRGWDNFPVQDYFAERLEVPCIIDNNANAAALAEAIYGVGKKHRTSFYLGWGRGIGGALIANSTIYHGKTSMAGEVGHLLVKEDGPICSCGGVGHLEALASGRALVDTLLLWAAKRPETLSVLENVTQGNVERLTVEQVFQLATQGETLAQQVVEQAVHYLSIALSHIIHLVNPGILILGGAVAHLSAPWLPQIRERVQQLSIPVSGQDVQIVLGSLGEDANVMGAVTLALQDL